MKRNNVKNLIENNDVIIIDQTPTFYVVKGSELKGVSRLLIARGANANILFLDDAETHLNIVQEENAMLNFKFLNKENMHNSNIEFDLWTDATLNLSFADFSHGTGIEKITINLLKRGARCDWYLSSIASENDNKEFKVLINHIAPMTVANANSYGVAKDHSRLVFSGISHIQNKAKKSKTKQNARIMVFSKTADAIAKPILKIDENDIEAGHSAALGQVNEEHLFYLKSRGISESEAKTLIVMGYLKPILKNFEDDEVREEIEQLILKRV